METSVVKRSIMVGGHKTSASLEDPFWDAVKEVAVFQNLTLRELVSQIDIDREHSNLSSAIRVFVLDHFMSRALMRPPKASGSEAARP
jgi:predicted DNA-binding ribbon-helix-helix protein